MTTKRRASAALLALLLGIAGAVTVAVPAHAATLPPVDSTTDDGTGYTLREAIADAESGAYPGADTIVFAPSLLNSTIQIDSVLLISESLTIQGLGSGSLSIGTTVDSDFFAFRPDAAGQSFTLTGITVQGNQIRTGMGIFSGDDLGFGADLIAVEDVVFSGLITSVSGAGMGIYDANRVTITDSEFISNQTTESDGGAVHAENVASVDITGSLFAGNSASEGLAIGGGYGGAVNVFDVGTLTVSDSTFGGGPGSMNAATYDGGAIAARNMTGDVTLTGVDVIGNLAGDQGGGIYVGEIDGIHILGGEIRTNAAVVDGGGLYIDDTAEPSSIVGAVFDGNAANRSGGAVGISGLGDEQFTIDTSQFFSNAVGGDQVPTYGAAIAIWSGDAGSTFAVDDSTFASNYGSGAQATWGVSIFADAMAGVISIVNSTLAEQEPEGGLYTIFGSVAAGGAVNVAHSTLIGNGVLGLENNASSATLNHSILVTEGSEPIVSVAGGNAVAAQWSLFSAAAGADVVLGAGNQQSADPQLGPLQNNGGPTLTMAPALGSTAINRGDPGIGITPFNDQRGPGFARVVQVVDIGAVEYQQAILPATGPSQQSALPWIAGVALLAGLAAVAFSVVLRRRSA